MEFKKLWTNTGELDFTNDAAVFDITAKSQSTRPLSNGVFTPVDRWNSKGELSFSTPWANNGQLDFVIESDGSTAPLLVDVIGNSYAIAPISSANLDLVCDLSAVTNNKMVSTGTLDSIADVIAYSTNKPVVSNHEIGFDINVDRGIKSEVKSDYQKPLKVRRDNANFFKQSPSMKRGFVSHVQDAINLHKETITLQTPIDKLAVNNIVLIRNALHIQSHVNQINYKLDSLDNVFLSDFAEAAYLSNEIDSRYLYPARADCEISNYWQETEKLRHSAHSNFGNGIAIKKEWNSYFEDGIYPVGERLDVIVPPTPIPDLPIEPLEFKSLWNNSGKLDFLTIEMDALIIMNQITVYYIANDGNKVSISPINASLNFDIDSQVWSFKGQLIGADSLTYLGYRSQYEIHINGHEFLFTLREYARSTSFQSESYTFTSVTSSQWLFSPYVNLYSKTVDTEVGAWQIVDEILNKESFTLSRSELTPEWVLAPDSFSYLNKPAIELIMQIADACGSIIQPDKTKNIIHAQPRYKVSPWNWPYLTNSECDHVVSADYVITESSSDNTTTQINNVLISGEAHGVITNAIKTGTAGDVRATDVISVLSQSNTVNTELARNIMSDSGKQEILGINIPLLSTDSDCGLFLPGEIVRIIYEDKAVTGLCLSNNIAIQTLTDISQSVKLEVNNGYS
ncbi:hypothetical protein [Psychromonas arctica]|uniref:hypothetical protein n=1 Tax=Psychromonas arctica TaxID=168275 RepID=UPI002FCEEBDE